MNDEPADVSPPIQVSTNMLVVEVPGSSVLAGPPRAAFVTTVRDYAVDVLGEASRIEIATRGATSIDVQYTTAHFDTAAIYVRDRGYVPVRKRWVPWAKVAAPCAFFTAGVAVPMLFLPDPWVGWGLVAGASFVLAVVLSAVVEVAGARAK